MYLSLGCIYSLESEVAQSCPSLCDPMDCSLPGSSICGIFQARILEWVAISFPQGSSQPGYPAFQADSLPSEPPYYSKTFQTRVGLGLCSLQAVSGQKFYCEVFLGNTPPRKAEGKLFTLGVQEMTQLIQWAVVLGWPFRVVPKSKAFESLHQPVTGHTPPCRGHNFWQAALDTWGKHFSEQMWTWRIM